MNQDKIIEALKNANEKQISRIASILGITADNKNTGGRGIVGCISKRELTMKQMFLEGKTFAEIGVEYHISRERVRQLLKKYFNITRKDGGIFSRTTSIKINLAIDRARKRKLKIESTIARRFFCGVDEFIAINGEGWTRRKGTPALAYYNQWHSAVHDRGIEWRITFPEWWKIWQDSGKWEHRGRGKGYCMTRIGDTGPYSPENVEIKTVAQNFSDSYFKHPSHERREKIKIRRRGTKTHCWRGHERNMENTRYIGGEAICKLCQSIRAKEARKNKLKSLLTPNSGTM